MATAGRPDPPYLRIAAEIRRRIASGDLRPGDRVPSTREITRRWGVAMATATKVLATLRDEGLVRTVSGVGTVVDRVPVPRPPEPRSPEHGLRRDQIVRVAVGIADGEGLEAVSMRRLAAQLGVSVMALYRYVPSKEALVHGMVEAAFRGSPPPEPGPDGWRARLELCARLQWELFRRHPWLVQVISITRPLLIPDAMAHVDWMLRAVDGLGLDMTTMLDAVVSLSAYVHGVALSRSVEAEAEQDTGTTSTQWWTAQEPHLADVLASGRFPMLARFSAQDADLNDLDRAFEFGLQRHLDGLESLLRERTYPA